VDEPSPLDLIRQNDISGSSDRHNYLRLVMTNRQKYHQGSAGRWKKDNNRAANDGKLSLTFSIFILFFFCHFVRLCFVSLGLDGDLAGALLLGNTLVRRLVGSLLDGRVAAEGGLDEVLALSTNLGLDGGGTSTEALRKSSIRTKLAGTERSG